MKRNKRTLEDVLDRSAHLVVAHEHNLVDQARTQAERLLPNLPHCRPIRKQSDLLEREPLSRTQALVKRIGIVRLNADNLDERSDRLDVRQDTRQQSSSSHANEDRDRKSVV